MRHDWFRRYGLIQLRSVLFDALDLLALWGLRDQALFAPPLTFSYSTP